MQPFERIYVYRFFIRCGKSLKKYKRRLSFLSTTCWQYGFLDVIPKRLHIPLFHRAPSHMMQSTLNQLFSNSTTASRTIWHKTSPVAAPRLRKAPTDWTQCPWKGWKRRTSAWSPGRFRWSAGVYFPRSVKPMNCICSLLNLTSGDNFISSMSNTPKTIKICTVYEIWKMSKAYSTSVSYWRIIYLFVVVAPLHLLFLSMSKISLNGSQMMPSMNEYNDLYSLAKVRRVSYYFWGASTVGSFVSSIGYNDTAMLLYTEYPSRSGYYPNAWLPPLMLSRILSGVQAGSRLMFQFVPGSWPIIS